VEEAEKTAKSTDPNPSEAIFDLDKEFKEKFAKSDLPWNSNAYYQRASVTILSDTDLTDKASDQTLKAIRISDRQTVVEPEVDKPVAKQSTTPESNLSNEKFPDDTLLVLSLDSVRFGLGEDHEFKLLTEACDKYGDIVARLSIPRSSIYKPAETKKFKTFITNFAGFVEKQKEKDSDRTRTRILVVSSEGLRNAGYDISYRVTWERTVTDTVAIVQKRRTDTRLSHLFDTFSHIAVTFYNDGVVLVPLDAEKEVIVVADPSGIESDLHRRFNGSMRGTETLVATSLAYELGKIPSDDGARKLTLDQRLQKALVHGVKSSRYLQCRGYTTLHSCAYHVLNKKMQMRANLAGIKDPKYVAFYHIFKKHKINNVDVLRYFWNRTRSIRFALDGGIEAATSTLEAHGDAGKGTKICTWPMGDLVEIIAAGYPMFGGFPPVALLLTEGRELIESETRKVVASWQASGWLEIGRVPQATVLPPDSRTRHYPWWSFRSAAVGHFAKALKAGNNSKDGFKPGDELNIARFLICETLVRFGYQKLNRSGDSYSKSLDFLAMERIFHYGKDLIPVPVFYGKFFDGFKFAKFFSVMAEQEVLNDASFTELEDYLKTHNEWLGNPASGSMLGILPVFETGRLHTSDRRDAQSYRDLRERLLGYRWSKEKKPLNLLVLGGPGSGKSFAVQEIIKGVYKGEEEIAFLEYNVASFGGDRTAMTSAFLEIQDVALKGKLPIAFWDEYDTSIGNDKLAWLASFLGPMQDGQFLIGQTSRSLPKCIFVFAGSIFSRFDEMRTVDALVDSPDSFELASGYKISKKTPPEPNEKSPPIYEIVDQRTGAEEDFHDTTLPVNIKEWKGAKGRDFKSRITGVLDIASVDRAEKSERHFSLQEDEDAWLFRRACSLRTMFEIHAGHLLNDDRELQISNDTLFSLLTTQRFSHGQRSVESLVRMSSLHGRAVADGSVVPTAAQVRLHAEKDFFHADPVVYQDMRDKWFGTAVDVSQKVKKAKRKVSQSKVGKKGKAQPGTANGKVLSAGKAKANPKAADKTGNRIANGKI